MARSYSDYPLESIPTTQNTDGGKYSSLYRNVQCLLHTHIEEYQCQNIMFTII